MVLCIAGKNNIAVDILLYAREKYPSLRIICVPNRTDSGKNGWQRSLKWHCIQYGIQICQLEDVYPIEDLLFLSLEFDRIIDPEKFKSDRLFNCHFSLLPAYKGVYTAALPILYGEDVTGVTLHRMDRGMDTGDIIAQRAFPLEKKSSRDVYFTCIEYGTQMVKEYMDILMAGEETATPQPSAGSTYYSKYTIDYANLQIDLRQTANNIQHQILAFCFREYQLPQVCGHAILDAEILPRRSAKKPGTIMEQDANGFVLASIDYDIKLYFDRLEELLEDCANGDLDGVKEITAVTRHLNEHDKMDGTTPLLAAAQHGQTAIVEYLLAQGADGYAADHRGETLLSCAERTGPDGSRDELLTLCRKWGIQY